MECAIEAWTERWMNKWYYVFILEAWLAMSSETSSRPTRYHGHLWPYYPVTCDPILTGHLRPYYPVTCDPIPLFTQPPCVPPYNGLHSTSLFKLTPPCVPLIHCLHSTSLFKLPPPCAPLYHGLHSTSLFKLFPPCVSLNHCLRSTSLFKLPPLRSTTPWTPFYFFI